MKRLYSSVQNSSSKFKIIVLLIFYYFCYFYSYQFLEIQRLLTREIREKLFITEYSIILCHKFSFIFYFNELSKIQRPLVKAKLFVTKRPNCYKFPDTNRISLLPRPISIKKEKKKNLISLLILLLYRSQR